MTACMRPERRTWGPSVDIRDAEVVADIFRGFQDLVDGLSVSVAQQGHESEVWSLTISIFGWNELRHWLTAPDLGVEDVVGALTKEGWLTTAAERAEALELVGNLRAHCDVWSDFVDPDEHNLLELVADL